MQEQVDRSGVSVCPEGGGYTCSLLVAEEKGDLIGS